MWREFEALNKWEEVALEKERFWTKFRGHWHRWNEENTGWKEKKWREETMMDGERLLLVIKVKKDSTVKAKRDKKKKVKSKLNDESDLERKEQTTGKEKGKSSPHTTSSENEEVDKFISDILSSRPPPYNVIHGESGQR